MANPTTLTVSPGFPESVDSLPKSPMDPPVDAALEELKTLRAEVSRHREMEAELMQLLGTKRADRIIHDVRNLLQERIFLIAACREVGE